MSKFFLISEPDEGVCKCLAISNTLQPIIDFIKGNKYQPFMNLKIYTSHDAPLVVNYVDGKLFVQ